MDVSKPHIGVVSLAKVGRNSLGCNLGTVGSYFCDLQYVIFIIGLGFFLYKMRQLDQNGFSEILSVVQIRAKR